MVSPVFHHAAAGMMQCLQPVPIASSLFLLVPWPERCSQWDYVTQIRDQSVCNPDLGPNIDAQTYSCIKLALVLQLRFSTHGMTNL